MCNCSQDVLVMEESDLDSKEMRKCHSHRAVLVPSALCSRGQRGTIPAAALPGWGLLCPLPTATVLTLPWAQHSLLPPAGLLSTLPLPVLFSLCNLVFPVELCSPSVLCSSLSPPVTMRLLASCSVSECPCHQRGAGTRSAVASLV